MTEHQLNQNYRATLHCLCRMHSLLKDEVHNLIAYAEEQPDGPRKERLQANAYAFAKARRTQLWFLKRHQDLLLHFFNTDSPEQIAELPLEDSLAESDLTGFEALKTVPITLIGVPKDYGEPKARNWRMAHLGL